MERRAQRVRLYDNYFLAGMGSCSDERQCLQRIVVLETSDAGQAF